ncbi:MAG: hypothetical protein HY708_01845, partial [Ignavibacteriae bacterium]|nr:hypothetical protein [Ignavibacteriota bacterium]
MVRPLILSQKYRRRAVGLLLVAFALNFHSCATYSPTLIRINPSGPNTRKAAKGDLTVYAEEFVSGEKSQVAFDANMPAEGVLPILISVENTGRESVDVNITDIRLRGETLLKLLMPEDAAIRAQRGIAARALGWSMIVPIIT